MSDTPKTDELCAIKPSGMVFMQWVQEIVESHGEIERELNELKRGEFVCKKCGLRKDGEHLLGDF